MTEACSFLNNLHLQGKLKRKKIKGNSYFETGNLDTYFGCEPYDVLTTDAEPIKNTLFKKKTIKSNNPHRKTGKKNADIEGDDNSLYITISEADVRLKKAKIEAQEIKNEFERGKLVNRDEVELLFFEISRKVRDSLESIPARLSGLCVEKTKHQIEQLMIEEIKNTLTNLNMKL